jgi:hypothetical protein
VDIFNKKSKSDKLLVGYSVQYRGGHPEMLAKGLVTQVPIKLEIHKNHLTLKPTVLSKQYFDGDIIQYKDIYSVEYSPLPKKWLGLDGGVYDIIIHIDYNDKNFGRTEMRFEMLGFSYPSAAKKCIELEDYLRNTKARDNFLSLPKEALKDLKQENNDEDDIINKIEKLSSLKDSGILTEKEFEQKKQELLKKL